MSSYHYRIYGLRVAADAPLAPLPAAPPAPADILVRLAGPPIPPAPAGPPHAEMPYLRLWRSSAGAELRYGGGDRELAISIADGGSQISAAWGAECTLADVVPFLVGPAMGIALMLRGTPSLHAAAALVGGRALLLAGASGAGKSTSTAAMLRAGHALICEDVAALDVGPGQIWVRPGYPAIRMAAAQAPAMAALARGIYPLWSDPDYDDARRYVDLAGGAAFCPEPAPVGGIYLLGPREPGLAAPRIRALTPREALPALMANSYLQRSLLPGERQALFQLCARLAAALPVRLVHAPDDLGRLPDLAAAIVADFARAAR